MKQYKYKAKKGPHEVIEGTLAAENRDEAVDLVNRLGLIPVDITEQHVTKRGPLKASTPKETHLRVKPRSLLAFYRQLARLVKSGIPILRALNLLIQECEESGMKEMLQKIQSDVRDGANLSAALACYPKVFSSFDIGMIHTGEMAGKLDEALVRISDYHEQQEELFSKVRMALAYPAFIILMGILTVSFMLTQVIPRFSGLFRDLGQDLPLTTRILIAMSEGLSRSWPGILLISALFAFFLHQALKRNKERQQFDRLMLRIPKIGKILLMSELARFSRTIELLLRNGIPLIKSLRMAIPAVGNTALRSELQRCYLSLEQGGLLSQALRKSALFPGLFCQLVAMGEESGNLDDSLKEMSEWYEKDVTEALKVMMSLLEPVIILAVGIALTFIIVAVLLPVFSINNMAV